MEHDRYDKDILKQLTRIANSLEKMEKKIPDASRVTFYETCREIVNENDEVHLGKPMRED